MAVWPTGPKSPHASNNIFARSSTRKVLGTPARCTRFLDFGEAGNYHGDLEQYRLALAKEIVGAPPAKPASGG